MLSSSYIGVQCDDPLVINNADFTVSSTSYQTEVVTTCQAGWEFSPGVFQNTVHCNVLATAPCVGVWKNVKPCVEVGTAVETTIVHAEESTESEVTDAGGTRKRSTAAVTAPDAGETTFEPVSDGTPTTIEVLFDSSTIHVYYSTTLLPMITHSENALLTSTSETEDTSTHIDTSIQTVQSQLTTAVADIDYYGEYAIILHMDYIFY